MICSHKEWQILFTWTKNHCRCFPVQLTCLRDACPIFHPVCPHREAVGVQYLMIFHTWSSTESANNQPQRCLQRPQPLHFWDATKVAKIKSGHTPGHPKILVKAKAFLQISGLLGAEVWMVLGLKPIYWHLTLKDLKNANGYTQFYLCAV